MGNSFLCSFLCRGAACRARIGYGRENQKPLGVVNSPRHCLRHDSGVHKSSSRCLPSRAALPRISRQAMESRHSLVCPRSLLRSFIEAQTYGRPGGPCGPRVEKTRRKSFVPYPAGLRTGSRRGRAGRRVGCSRPGPRPADESRRTGSAPRG